MRRKEKEIHSNEAIEAILRRADVGRLGTVSGDGAPMIKPLNFVYRGGKIYFHTALEGEKIEHLTSNPRVCFETEEVLGYVPASDSPCQSNFAFRSVIIQGRARMLQESGEKIAAFEDLMAKYQPGAKLRPLTKEMVEGVGVVEITVESMTGKANRVP